jgi:flagellar hook-associated protein 2
MAGVKVSGLISGLNTQQIINELISADSVGINQVKAQQTTVNSEVTALGSLSTDMTTVENDVFNLEDPSIYNQVVGSSTDTSSTWQVSPTAGTTPGNYTLAVNQLATASQLDGAESISQPLSSSMDVSGVTLATMRTALAPTAGVFTVNGQQITVTTAESLADVFSAISTATGGDVTAAYDPSSDEVSLTSSTGSLTLGAANDTSNLLQALQLQNSGTASATSAAALGTASLSAPLASAGLKTALTGQDGSGNGSFEINGVSISYNTGTDTLTSLINKINVSSAGVTASYDPTNDQMILTNSITGNTAVNVSDTSGNLMASLGLTGTGATLTDGTNLLYSVNGGSVQSITSNNLTGANMGVPGLAVTVNTTGTQTLQVTTNPTDIANDIQSFITDFNTLQTAIQNDTQITTVNGSTVTSLLSSEHEVGDWATQMEDVAFSGGAASGAPYTSLDSLGIDFTGTTAQLAISDTGTLSAALSGNPAGVEAFFTTAKTGFGSMVNSSLSDIIGQDTSEQAALQTQSTALGDQITVMQSQLDAETATLNAEFTAMESFEAETQTESQTLNGLSGSGGTSSSGVLSSVTPTVTSPTSSTSTTGTSTDSSTTSGSDSTSSGST